MHQICASFLEFRATGLDTDVNLARSNGVLTDPSANVVDVTLLIGNDGTECE
jgi:hypothetical protein